ncbi:MAG: hypothetical protein WBQ20_15895 [Methyloceanibacter sp.]|jgi:hypothetical protein
MTRKPFRQGKICPSAMPTALTRLIWSAPPACLGRVEVVQRRMPPEMIG